MPARTARSPARGSIQGLLKKSGTAFLAAGDLNHLPVQPVLADRPGIRPAEFGEDRPRLGVGQASADDRAVQRVRQLPDAITRLVRRIGGLRWHEERMADRGEGTQRGAVEMSMRRHRDLGIRYIRSDTAICPKTSGLPSGRLKLIRSPWVRPVQ